VNASVGWGNNMEKIITFANIFVKIATDAKMHKWASGIVNKAFYRVMGRAPTPAERQIVMAVSDLESSYGHGWGKGESTGGQNSHNWGAIQTKNESGFAHHDSSAKGKYLTKFKTYPDDVSGAMDVVAALFKSSRKQHEPNPKDAYRANGKEIAGPNRGELIQAAAAQGDTAAFSRAMWYTGYYEGTDKKFTDRMKQHMNGLQSRINNIASAIGEAPAWSIKTNHFLPTTNDTKTISTINSMIGNDYIAPSLTPAEKPTIQSPGTNVPLQQQPELNDSFLWWQ
jgi:hypothetical protein